MRPICKNMGMKQEKSRKGKSMSYLKRVQKSITAAKYSVHVELNEDGSSDHVVEVALSKKVVEGLKNLPPQKLSALKKDLKDVFLKHAVQG